MVWGAFCDRETVSLCNIDGRMNSKHTLKCCTLHCFPSSSISRREFGRFNEIAHLFVSQTTQLTTYHQKKLLF